MSSFLKSTLLTNRDATPKVLTDAFLGGGIMEEVQGSVKVGTSDSANSYYRLVQVPSNSKLSQIYWQSDAIGTSAGSIFDLGVWFPTSIQQGGGNFLSSGSAGVIIASSIFAAGLTANTANALTEITNQSLNYTIALQETPLWNVLGFASDPEIDFDMGFVTRVATGAAGYISLKVRYQY
jgi:hypothetical protein